MERNQETLSIATLPWATIRWQTRAPPRILIVSHRVRRPPRSTTAKRPRTSRHPAGGKAPTRLRVTCDPNRNAWHGKVTTGTHRASRQLPTSTPHRHHRP